MFKPKDTVVVYFHNLGFDFSYLINDVFMVGTPIIKDNQLFQINCNLCGLNVIFRDSYKILPMKLADVPKFAGINNFEKEVYPYYLNTWDILFDQNDNINGEVRYDQIVDENDRNHIKMVCEKLKFDIDDETFDLIAYSEYYCQWDVDVLYKGMETLKNTSLSLLGLNSYDYLSLSSLADAYLKKCGVYDDIYEIGGVCWDFIQKTVVGGWTMCRNNEKQIFEESIEQDVMQDFDAVSLYPSAMAWLIKEYGLPTGIPNMLDKNQINLLNSGKSYKDLNLNAIFVKVIVNSIGIKLAFPL